MNKLLFSDFETRSKLDLRKVGLDRYARHPSTRVLMLAAALDNGSVGLWEPHRVGALPPKLRELILDPEVKIVAHNAAFERAIFNHVLGFDLPPEKFICTMAMAYSLALPGGLDQLTRDALKLREECQKIAEGKKYIRTFCIPRTDKQINEKKPWEFNDWNTHPAEWDEFGGYCKQDVVAERKVYFILRKYFPAFEETMALWAFDQEINETGYPLDTQLIEGAIKIHSEASVRFKKQMRDLTGLANPDSSAQATAWLKQRGYPFASIKKDRVKVALKDFGDKMTPEAKEFLSLRSAATKTSIKKFPAMLRAMCPEDQRLRGTLQFCGAGRTGRWAGRVAQFQNLPRPVKAVEPFLNAMRSIIRDADYDTLAMLFDNPLDVLTSSIRSAIAAPDGYSFHIADLSSIELCVIAWITGCEFWLDVLKRKLDPYKAFGVHYLGVPYEEITKQQRNECKPPALGAGYRLGGGELRGVYPDQVKTGLWGYAENMGVNLTQEQSKRAVETYRDLSPEVVQMWYDLENAARDCIKDQQPRRVGMFTFDIKAPFLRIRLPSGRHLFYCRPRVEKQKIKTGRMVTVISGGVEADVEESYEKWVMTYEGVHQQTKAWVRMPTQGGKLIENLVQAIARDILVYGMWRAKEAGFTLVGHVHDELIALERNGGRDYKLLELCMTAVPPWAKGLPLAANGFQSTFYKKD